MTAQLSLMPHSSVYPFLRPPELTPQRQLISLLGHISNVHSHAPHVFLAHFGVFTVTCRNFTWDELNIRMIHFWPGRIVDGSISVGQGCFYEHPDPIGQIAVGASGTYVLLLVRWLPWPTAFQLESVAHHISEIGHDALGLVFAVDSGGKIKAISYV
ncbi:hypothetical protein B0H13DRAFT_2374961 [Mycena leptocephala]|nr:hypothetical protein B0H13DRAFT_2374961 [Mycena leptocephala]